MKRKFKKICNMIKFLFSFPVFWVVIFIVVLIITSLFVSINLHNSGSEYLSTIFSNVFAGLITGLVIAILSGSKTVYCSYMEARLLWLEETHKMILDHFEDERKLWGANQESDDIFYDLAYDTASKANWVNERIMQSSFSKVKWFDPPKYFKKKFDFDCMKTHKILSDLRDFIIENGNNREMRKDTINEIRTVSSIMRSLNHDILSDMDSIKIKLAGAKKSII